MRKILHIIVTAGVILLIDGFVVRIVDGSVQIDDDGLLLVLLIVVIDVLIAFISFRLYRRLMSR